MKKFIVSMILVVAIMGLVGCGKKTENTQNTQANVTTEQTKAEPLVDFDSNYNSATFDLEVLGLPEQLLVEYEGFIKNNEFKAGTTVKIIHVDEAYMDSFKRVLDLTFDFYEFNEEDMSLTFEGDNTPEVKLDLEKKEILITQKAIKK